ncbi:MAG: hypothetical protein WDO72_04915 [Pseudomonadota bacterium]
MNSPAVLDVELEAVDTWPPEFLQAAVQNRELILSFQRERQRIDRLGWDDIRVRINPPENRYEDEYKALVDRLDGSLVRHRIVGYHCTRLTPGEIRSIKANGLRLLSTDLVRQRLDSCVADGHMTSAQCEYLVGSQIMRESLGNLHGNRTGMIWFCPNRSTLQESSGVYRLFRSWGGEAVYLGHEEDEKIAAVLAGIGTPCIVKCAIPFPCDDPYYPQFAARFFSQFISNDFEYPEPSPGFDLCTERDLLGSEVLEVIEFSDPRFESLTACSTWPAPYGIIGAT